jgi:hypothetical protein
MSRYHFTIALEEHIASIFKVKVSQLSKQGAIEREMGGSMSHDSQEPPGINSNCAKTGGWKSNKSPYQCHERKSRNSPYMNHQHHSNGDYTVS